MSRHPTISQLLARSGLDVNRPSRHRQAEESKTLLEASEACSNGAASKISTLWYDRETSKPQDEDATTSDIDERIAELERDLGGDSWNSSDRISSKESEEEGKEPPLESIARGSDGGKSDTAAKLVSSLEEEKIEPLPRHFLPRPGCGIPKANKKSIKKPCKRPKLKSVEHPQPLRGLDSAVKELLDNYEARSSERVPFYCRICKFQGDSLEGLERHKLEPLHVEATKKERKLSTCSLCKKQFTSPPQLKEHLAGKGHMERLQAAKFRQGKWVQQRRDPSHKSGVPYSGSGVSQARRGPGSQPKAGAKKRWT